MCFRGDPWGKVGLGLNRKPEKVGRLVGTAVLEGGVVQSPTSHSMVQACTYTVCPSHPRGHAPTVVKWSPPSVGLSYEPRTPTCEQFLALKVIFLEPSSFVSSKKVAGVCLGAGQGGTAALLRHGPLCQWGGDESEATGGQQLQDGDAPRCPALLNREHF